MTNVVLWILDSPDLLPSEPPTASVNGHVVVCRHQSLKLYARKGTALEAARTSPTGRTRRAQLAYLIHALRPDALLVRGARASRIVARVNRTIGLPVVDRPNASTVPAAQQGVQASGSPDVSIALPTLNAERTIERAIRSIQQQTLTSWELLVFDGGSDDETLARIASMNDPRIRVIGSGQREGLPVSLNECVRAARGRIIARMDADDVCFPERLAQQVAFLDANPNIDLVGAGMLVYQGDGRVRGVTPVEASHDILVRRAYRGFHLPHPTWAGRREWFERHAYDRAMSAAEDQQLLYRTYRSSRFACLPAVLLGYREEPRTLSKMWRGRIRFTHAIVRHSLARGRIDLAGATLVSQAARMGADILNIKFGITRMRNKLHEPAAPLRLRWQKLWQATGTNGHPTRDSPVSRNHVEAAHRSPLPG